MPPKKRSKASVQEPGSSISEPEHDSSGQSDTEQEIQVDFEAFTICEEDFHGIRGLLRQSFAGSSVNVSTLTDLIIKQADHVGSSIKVCDEGDGGSTDSGPTSSNSEEECVFGVITLIHLNYYREEISLHMLLLVRSLSLLLQQTNECVKQMRELLLSQCKSHAGSLLHQLTEILSTSVGLVISERLLNIPAEIAPPMLNSLLSELKEGSRKHTQQFACTYYVVVTRSHLEPTIRKRKHKGKNKKQAPGENCEPVFDYVEWEILQKESILSFSYPVVESTEATDVKQRAESDVVEHCRTVLIFEATKFSRAVSHLEECMQQ